MKRLQSIERLDEFSVVITQNQTAGKGLRCNFWESEKDKNLTFSILLYPKFIDIQYQFRLTFIITVAIITVLKKYLTDIKIKWTNDIYVNDKKLCGILIENTVIGGQIGYSIIGIGLNINQITFMSNAPNPTSMKLLTNKDFDVETLFQEIKAAIIKHYSHCASVGFDDIRNIYHAHLYRNNGFHLYKDKTEVFSAKIIKIEDTGMLILVDNEGKRREYGYGEVVSFG